MQISILNFTKPLLLGLSIAFILTLAACSQRSAPLKPFTTDGCSIFPEGTLEHQSLWSECCIRHDLTYWRGGTYQQKIAADQALKQCVAQVGEPEIAELMLTGVRVGGSAYLPTSFRWGYGWPWPRGYKALNTEEKQQVEAQLNRAKLILNSLSDELKLSNQ